jgi:heme-degrading monooxygenase HmoA
MFMSKRSKFSAALIAAVVLSAGVALRLRAADDKAPAAGDNDRATPAAVKAGASGKDRFFEMRTYYVAPGKIDNLNARFRDHTNTLFRKHGIETIGYWQRVDNKDVLVYILAYPSREAREQSWKDFFADPDWQAAAKKSEENGKIVAKVESVYLTPTDYSPIK